MLRITTTNIPAGRQHTVKDKASGAAHERMRVKQGSFLTSPAWPQPRLPLGQSCYASLPFKQMRKCSSSLPNDLFGPEPRQVSFQPMRPRVPPTQLLLTIAIQPGIPGPPVSRVPKSFQSHHQKEFTSCPPKIPKSIRQSPHQGLLQCPHAYNTPMLWGWGGVIGPRGLCCKRYTQEVLCV